MYADVVLSIDNDSKGTDDKNAEIVLKLKDKLFTSKEKSNLFETAVDKTIYKLDSQIYKYKDKLTSKKNIKSKSSYKTI